MTTRPLACRSSGPSAARAARRKPRAAAMAAARPRSTQLPPGSEMPGGFARGDRDCGEALVTMVAGPADMGGLPSPGSAVWRADDGGDDGGDTDIRGDEEAAGEDGDA